jgi:nicotinate phosphoribosyltransferase
LQELLGSNAVYLVDTYDTLEGTRRAASLGRPLWGVRLDSGNLAELSRAVRRILDQAGLHDAKIMVSGDLNEYKVLELAAANLPIDALGVGTDLATSADAHKLVEIEIEGIKRYTAKFSHDKQTLPGAKQVFRYASHDTIGCAWECPSCPEGAPPSTALLRPIILNGELLQPLPSARQARDHARACIAALPPACLSLHEEEQPWPVDPSSELLALYNKVRHSVEASEQP